MLMQRYHRNPIFCVDLVNNVQSKCAEVCQWVNGDSCITNHCQTSSCVESSFIPELIWMGVKTLEKGENVSILDVDDYLDARERVLLVWLWVRFQKVRCHVKIKRCYGMIKWLLVYVLLWTVLISLCTYYSYVLTTFLVK